MKVSSIRKVFLVVSIVASATFQALLAAWRPGLRGGIVEGSLNKTAFPDATEIYLDPHAATNSSTEGDAIWKKNHTWVYWGQIFLGEGPFFLGEHIWDSAEVKIDDEVVLTGRSWNSFESSAPLLYEPGWHDIVIRFGQGSGRGGLPDDPSVRDVDGLRAAFGISSGDQKPTSMADCRYPVDPGDGTLFRYDDGRGFDDSLMVQGNPKIIGTAEPSYGLHEGLVSGQAIVCSVSPEITDGATTYRCTGWSLLTNDVPYMSGTGPSLDYTHPGSRSTLVWTFQPNHTMTFTASEGGTVSDGSIVVEEGGSVSVTAVPGDGYVFFHWTGDTPLGTDLFDPVFSFAVDRPRTLTALFRPIVSPQAKVYTGPKNGAWETAENWTPAGVPTLADDVHIPASAIVKVAHEAMVSSLTISNNAIVSVNGAGNPAVGENYRNRKAQDVATTGTTGIRAIGDVALLGNSRLVIGGKDQLSHPSLEVGGDLSLSGKAIFTIYAGPLVEGYDYVTGGASVLVGGTMTVGSGCTVYPFSHSITTLTLAAEPPNSGLAVTFDAGAVVVEDGGTINADGIGFSRYSLCPVVRDTTGAYLGGGYGGKGGNNGFGTYGYAFAPLYPGCAAGNAWQTERWGGGIIRLTTRDATIGGTLTVCGGTGSTSGGGAGGGIFLVAGRLTMESTASLQAKGGFTTSASGGGGGGGRISLVVGLDSARLSELCETGETTGVAVSRLADILPPEQFSVEGGKGGKFDSDTDDGEAGTAWYLLDARGKTPVTIRTDPPVPATLDPVAGLHGYAPGTTVTATASEYIPFEGREDIRIGCAGYRLTDGNGSVISEADTGHSVTFTVGNEPLVLSWRYGTSFNRLKAVAAGKGTVSFSEEWKLASESFSTLTATPDDETSLFGYWAGDVSEAQRFQNPLTLTAGRPRVVKAVFVSSSPATTYTWNKRQNSVFFQWTDAACWDPEGIPGPNDTAVIPGGGQQKNVQIDDYACVGNLIITGKDSSLRVGAVTEPGKAPLRDPEVQSSLPVTAPFGLHVLGNLTVSDKGFLAVGGTLNPQPCRLQVDGEFLVGGEGTVVIFGCETNGLTDSLFDVLSVMEVTGKATVAEGGVLYTGSHSRSGHSPELRFSDLHVEAGGTISSKELGYRSYMVNGNERCCPWPTHLDPGGGYLGAAYGGLGGQNRRVNGQYVYYGETYGYVNTPIHPGMEAGNHYPGGGGAIRIVADRMTLDGMVASQGADGSYSGGSSGGSVWIQAKEFNFSNQAIIDVSGGSTTRDNSGAGSGGRASICIGLTNEQLLALRTADEVEGVLRSDLSGILSGFTAAGGSVGGWNGSPGQPGTGVYLLNVAGRVSLNVVGEPVVIGAVSPAYGIQALQADTPFAISAPETAVIPGSGDRSRRVCSGYVVTGASGAVLAQGSSPTGELTLSEDATLAWDWSRLEHRIDLAVSVGGSIVTNSIDDPSSSWQLAGSEVSIEAVAADGYLFAGWLGDAEGLDRTKASLSFPVTGPRALRALFVTAAAGEKTWIGGDGSWLDPDGWDPAGLPGPVTKTFVSAGTVLLDSSFVMEIGPLSIGEGARVDVSGTGKAMTGQVPTESDYATDTVGLRVNGTLDLAGKLSVGGQNQLRTSLLSVAGDLLLSGGDKSALSVYAGHREAWDSPETFRLGGGQVEVGGLLSIGSNSVVRPFCDNVSGAPVVFRVGRLRLANGGRVDANDGGYYYDKWADGTFISHAPGGPNSSEVSSYIGGSYGGEAGGNKPKPTYGVDFAPYRPGSPGGNRNRLPAGGSIRIDCAGRAELFGAMTANGADARSNGGHSGGSIWITARRIDSAETTLLQAKGGDPFNHTSSMGGGGGRICLATHLTADQIAGLYTATELPSSITKTDLLAGEPALLKGTVDVDGGFREDAPARNGHQGTAVFLDGPAAGLILIVR